jgi:hypothetical protein
VEDDECLCVRNGNLSDWHPASATTVANVKAVIQGLFFEKLATVDGTGGDAMSNLVSQLS